MKGGCSGIIGELHKDVGSSQRNDVARCRHPDESNNVDEGANEDVWPAATQGGQSPSRSIAEQTEQWISEERDKGPGDQYECQGLPFIQVSDHLENLARKNDNTKGSPVKVECKPENADGQDLCQWYAGKFDRQARREGFSSTLLYDSHG